MKRVVLFNTEDQADLIIEQQAVEGTDIQLELHLDQNPAALPELCKEADAVITIYAPVDARVIEQLPKCKLIAQQAVGYNNVDVKAATEHGICVSNVPDFCLYDVALHTVALTLACARRIVALDKQVKGGKWGYKGYRMHRLRGQTFGMIAFGNIPREIAPTLQRLGMDILTYDPRVSDEVLEQYGVRRAQTLESLLRESDYVSVHCPLTEKTVGLIGERELHMMKKDAYLINTARGRIVDEFALRDALANQIIAGAALDVLEVEEDGQNPLFELDNLIVTPHTAFYSEEAVEDVRRKAIEQVIMVLRDGKAPSNLINPEVLGRARFQG